MTVLGGTPDYPAAICRYVEGKCLLGGVTASQGVTLQNFHLQRFYRGVVRNLEAPIDPSLPRAHAKITDVEASNAEKFLNRLRQAPCFLLHLSEGIDSRARAHFTDLNFASGKWAIASSLAGIHCTGLKPEDFAVLARFGASMVWSPLSNLLLYGGTGDVAAAKAAGVKIALGSDWSPTGSKNLLGELKAAKAHSETSGGIFTDQEIVAMATRNASAILGWNQHLGSLEPGKLADLVVIREKTGDPYAKLIAAREYDINLVVIGGGFLVLEHEEPGFSERPRFSVARQPVKRLSAERAAIPLSRLLHPLDLDSLTAAADEDYVEQLMAQANLPKPFAEELAAMLRKKSPSP